MLSSLKEAKKYMHVYHFHGKHFTCWDLRGVLETDNFGKQDNKRTSLKRILLAVRAEVAKSPTVIFLCQHETWQTTLLHLQTAQKSLFSLSKCPPDMKNEAVWS